MISNAKDGPNQVAMELIGRDYLSYSSISAYRRCPLAFFYRYVEGVPEDTVSSALVFGVAIHAALEHHFSELMTGAAAPELDSMLTVFWDSWRDRGEEQTIRLGKNEDASTITDLAKRVLTAFQQSEFAKPAGRIIGIEEEVRGELVSDVPDMLGRIDLLTETDEAITVVDFKTSRSRWSPMQAEDAGEQLLAYSELFGNSFSGKSIRLEFLILTKTKAPTIEQVSVPVSSQSVRRLQAVVTRVWRAITTGNFYPTPSPMVCSTCSFRERCRRWCG